MSSEAEWVGSLVERLSTSLQVATLKDRTVVVANGKRLAYSHEIHAYKIDDPARRQFAAYQTDLLVFDRVANEEWIPRVVVECKLGNITTHDALTYSTKASTHKQVHPYLRYGILIGLRKGYGIPGYLFRHGAYFDFMATWAGEQPKDAEWDDLTGLLIDEVRASRKIQELLTTTRSRSRQRYTLVHRPLKLT